MLASSIYSQQKGTVLVVAVFIVSIIAAIAIRFAAGFQLSFARAEQGVMHTQLQQLVLSAEDFAAWVLVKDADDDKNNGRYAKNGIYGSYDHLQENWVTPLQVPIEEATLDASIEDALSRFNLNQLQGRPSPYNASGIFNERFTVAQQRFMRLLQTQPDDLIDASLAESITQAVIDWVDADSTPTGAGGAENSYYESLEKPYRAANGFFSDVTELRQVKGVTKEIYDYISPFLIALPNTEGFNINTASVTVMRTLNQQNVETPLTESDALILIGQRPDTLSSDSENTEKESGSAYESVEDFLTSSEANQVFDTNPTFWPTAKGLRTGSEYFLLTIEVSLLEYQRRQVSIIKRENIDTGVTALVVNRQREHL